MIDKQRLACMRCFMGILKYGTKAFFPNGRLGNDIVPAIIIAVVRTGPLAGKKCTAARVAETLEMPRETARRHLNDLVERGFIRKDGRHYVYCGGAGDAHVKGMTELIRRTAAHLCGAIMIFLPQTEALFYL